MADRHDALPRVLVTLPYPDPGPRLLREACDATVWEDPLPLPRADLLRLLPEVEGVMATIFDRLDREALDRAPKLRAISCFGVGYDYVDVPAATERGIVVCNTPGVLAECVADHAFALLLAVGRRLAEHRAYAREGRLVEVQVTPALYGREIGGATLGIIGLGAIGTGVARRARGFAMRVIYTGRTRKPEVEAETGAEWASLDDLLRQADYVSIHTALTPETRGLIGARELALMKPSVVLVNTARGPIVDTEALTAALRDGRLFGAGLDVTDPEPLPRDHPLLSLENALIAPHTGSAGVQTRARMSELAARNLIDALAGRRPRHLVNSEAWRDR